VADADIRHWDYVWSDPELAGRGYRNLSRGERERIEAIISLMPDDAESILDVGCGSGVLANELVARGREGVAGLDISEEALAHVAAERIVGSAAAMPVADGAFDLVVAADVLEHLPAGVFERALAELERVARRYVIVNSPHRERLDLARTYCSRCTTAFHASRHVRAIAVEDLATWLPGFELVEARLCGEPWPYRVAWFQLVSQAVGGTWYRDLRAVCPNCGYPLGPIEVRRWVRFLNGGVQRLAVRLGGARPSEFVALVRRR
jgi:SAM-dependent methyltransferase